MKRKQDVYWGIKTLDEILREIGAAKVFIVHGEAFRHSGIDAFLAQENMEIFHFIDFSPNPKREEIEKGVKEFISFQPDLLIACGGGSAIDTAKCIKYFAQNEGKAKAPVFMAIPTTAGSGSESTAFAVVYKNGNKLSVESDDMLPDKVILESRFLDTLSDYQKRSTLLDALCQAMESFWARGANTESREYARKAIQLILDNYQKYIVKGSDMTAAAEIMRASNYAGRAINISKTTAAHAMSYKLTSLYGIAHGHAVGLCMLRLLEIMSAKKDKEVSVLLDKLGRIMTQDSEKNVKGVFDEIFFNLGLEDRVYAKSEHDVDVLSASVNEERLKNYPLKLTKSEIKAIYADIVTSAV